MPQPSAMIDLRSDTITKPTPAMREAMARAEVGDDVFGDDPTVKELERRTAEILGKEAAVFVPSGTMANQIAVRVHTEPGDELLVDGNAHIYYYEGGGFSAISGVTPRCLNGRRGIFTSADVKAALRPQDVHFPLTKLVCIENTHNRGGGSIWKIDQITEVTRISRDAGLKLHLDGARLWNASIATGIPEKTFASHFDSVSVCFSKGLGAPVGSALAGTQEFVQRAHRFRKQFGGGMRQAGIIAAGALYALEHQRERLAEDHANAKYLAEGLTTLPGVALNVFDVESNIVRFRVPGKSAPEIATQLHALGVWMIATGPDIVRAVTSLMVHRRDMERAMDAVGRVMLGVK